MSNIYGRQVIVPLTNKSGGSVIAGDVVVIDTGNNAAFTTTTSAGSTVTIGIAQESIANNGVGRVLTAGYAALVNVNASVTRGNYGKTHTVAKQATDAGASRGTGTFCQFLTGGTTPDAIMYPVDLLGTSLTNPMTNVGDIIYGGTAGVPTRLADVAVGSVLLSGGVNTAPAWGFAALTVAKVAVTTDVSISAATYTDVFSLALGAGTWDLIAYLTTNGNATNPGAAYNTYAELVTGSSTRIAQNVIWTPKYGVSPTLTPYQSLPVMAFDIAGSQTIKLRCYCDVATAVMGSTTLGTGAGTVLRAIRTA